jgi:hypothetical protein
LINRKEAEFAESGALGVDGVDPGRLQIHRAPVMTDVRPFGVALRNFCLLK